MVDPVVSQEIYNKLAEKMDSMNRTLIQLEVKMDMVKDLNVKMDIVEKTADEALQSTRSGHKRIDKNESDITWLWRTVFGGIILGAIGVLFAFAKGAGV